MRKKTLTIVLISLVGLLNFLTGLKNKDIHLLSFDQAGKRSQVSFFEGQPLLVGQSVKISIKARYDNLGTVLMRFYNDNRDSNDQLVFRLADEFNNKIYESTYKTDQFLPNRLFSFGFPPQENSLGKTYNISLTSLSGSTESGILVSTNDPIFVLRSVLSKKEVLSNPRLVLNLLHNKVVNMLVDKSIVLKFLISFLPLMFYLYYLLYSNSGYGYLNILFLSSIFFGALVPITERNYYLLALIYCYYLISKHKDHKNSYGILISLILIGLGSALGITRVLISNYMFASALLVLAYCLIVKDNHKINFNDLWSKINNFSLIKASFTAKLLITITIIGFIAKYIYFAIATATPFLFVYKKLVGFPQNHFINILSFSIELFITILYLYLLLKLIKKRPLPLTFAVLACLLLFIYHYLSGVNYAKLTLKTRQPYIQSISPMSSKEAWVDVTISGKNFGDEPFRGQVLVGKDKTPQRVISWSDETIVFRTNPELTKSGDVCLATLKKGNTNCLLFEYLFNE